MKYSFVIILSLFGVISMLAQEHMQFRGCPINGTEKQLRDSLQARDFHWGMDGFTLKGYIGYVAGEKMLITINTTPETQVVYSLTAHAAKQRDWEQLKKHYLEIKELLKQKYGRPSSHSERFSKPALSRHAKRKGVRKGRCEYRTTFRAPHGTVILYIDSDSRVCIEFQDGKNAEINEKEIMSEI